MPSLLTELCTRLLCPPGHDGRVPPAPCRIGRLSSSGREEGKIGGIHRPHSVMEVARLGVGAPAARPLSPVPAANLATWPRQARGEVPAVPLSTRRIAWAKEDLDRRISRSRGCPTTIRRTDPLGRGVSDRVEFVVEKGAWLQKAGVPYTFQKEFKFAEAKLQPGPHAARAEQGQ